MNRLATGLTFLAGAVLAAMLLHGCGSRPDFGWPPDWRATPEPPHPFLRIPPSDRLVILTLAADDLRDRILVARTEPGEETLVLFRIHPDGELRFRAGRRIASDLQAYDYSSSGKGLRVAEVERILRDAREARIRPWRLLIDEHNSWLRRQADLAAERDAREAKQAEERRRLLEEATQGR